VQSIDVTVLMALSSIAVEQTKATEQTMSRCRQLLDYLLWHSGIKIHFQVSDMILNIHLDASYLSKHKACSQACSHFFMGWMPMVGAPIQLNEAFHVTTTILKFVLPSAAKAELGALHLNCQTGIIS
jgi:hypothetical protein